MKLKLLVLLAAMGTAKFALAIPACVVEAPLGFTPVPLTVNETGGPIEISATAAEGLFATLSSAPSTQDVVYGCQLQPNEQLSRESPLEGLTPYAGTANPIIYQTQISGIGVSFQSRGTGGGERNLPTPFSYYADAPINGYLKKVITPSYLTAKFYKMGKVDLSNAKYQEPALVLTQKKIGYAEMTKYTYLEYFVGNIRIISTPVCTVDQPIKIDYGIVTEEQTKADGISKKLDFGIRCDSDYGNYKAIASINAVNKSTDAESILVTDAAGITSNSLIIEIRDASNNIVKVDGSVQLTSPSVGSGVRAEYNWKAILKRSVGTNAPAKGNFKATAIITLDIV